MHASVRLFLRRVTLPELKHLIVVHSTSGPSYTVIDVRQPEEVAATGSIPSSVNIPLGELVRELSSPEGLWTRVGKPSGDGELIFYCQSGVRSLAASRLAESKGFKYVPLWGRWE